MVLPPEPQDLQALFDLSVDVLIVIDSENLNAYNPAASSAFGYPPEWVQEHNFRKSSTRRIEPQLSPPSPRP